jgi:superfamily II DNA or RNA helicase
MSKFPQNSRRRLPIAPPQELGSPDNLRQWQLEALSSWVGNGYRGIVAAATGSGKTRLALAAIKKFWEPGSRVAIVVPTIALQAQWEKALRAAFSLAPTQIGSMGGKAASVHEGHGFVICVINSARDGLRSLAAGWADEVRKVMLIVDECHWAATEANAEIFSGRYQATLGLSATPERSDDGLDDVLIPQLGKVIYRYSLQRALDDKLLAPLRLLNISFEVSPPELEEIQQIQLEITSIENRILELNPSLLVLRGLDRSTALLRASESNLPVRSLRDLYQQRSLLLDRSDGRRAALDAIASTDFFQHQRVLLFHERIEEAKRTLARFEHLGVRCALDLSTDNTDRRNEALRDFRSGAVNVLIAVRTLDEGIDLPDAKLAIIASGTYSPRQRLQRIGRVVRPTDQAATVITLLGRGTFEEEVINENDQFLVGSERVISCTLIEFLNSNWR